MNISPEIKGVRHGFFDPVNLRSYISIVAAATSYIAYTMPATAKRVVLRKLYWNNRQPAIVFLSVGYLNVAAVFVPVLPTIQMIPATPDGLTELEIPIAGNTDHGFEPSTVLLTGTLGNIILQASAAGAAPADVMVSGEVEVF